MKEISFSDPTKLAQFIAELERQGITYTVEERKGQLDLKRGEQGPLKLTLNPQPTSLNKIRIAARTLLYAVCLVAVFILGSWTAFAVVATAFGFMLLIETYLAAKEDKQGC